jgi:hypothetical protein
MVGPLKGIVRFILAGVGSKDKERSLGTTSRLTTSVGAGLAVEVGEPAPMENFSHVNRGSANNISDFSRYIEGGY